MRKKGPDGLLHDSHVRARDLDAQPPRAARRRPGLLAPTLPHFVWSLPPKGAAGRLGAARRRPGLLAPTLPHSVWSLPPRGAAGRLGAARRRPDCFVCGWLNAEGV